jgi:hypothetical protein
MTETLQLLAQLGIVVDLAVVDDREAPAGGREGLIRGGLQPDDGETVVPEQKIRRDLLDSCVIGAAMAQQRVQPGKLGQ